MDASELVADRAQKLLALLRVRRTFYTLRGVAIYDAQHTPALLALRHYDFHGIGRGAVDGADLEAVLDAAQHVDGVALAEQHHEEVPGPDGLGILDGGLVEGDGKLDPGHSVHHHLVEIFHRLDEMRLPENEVGVFGNLHADGLEFHGHTLPAASFWGTYYTREGRAGGPGREARGAGLRRFLRRFVNLSDSRDVAPALEGSAQPGVQDGQGVLEVHHALAEREHVGVVVLAGQPRRLRIPADGAPHALDAVGHHGFAVP